MRWKEDSQTSFWTLRRAEGRVSYHFIPHISTITTYVNLIVAVDYLNNFLPVKNIYGTNY